VLVAFQAAVSPRRVVVRYALTGAADVTLSVRRLGARGGTRVVARGRGSAGVNRIAWARRLGRGRAAPGRYRLSVSATAAGRRTVSSVTVRLPKARR
jgi:hypothetical protein